MTSHCDFSDSDSGSVKSLKRSNTNDAMSGTRKGADSAPTPAKKPRIALGSTPLYHNSSSATPVLPGMKVSDILIEKLSSERFSFFLGSLSDSSNDLIPRSNSIT